MSHQSDMKIKFKKIYLQIIKIQLGIQDMFLQTHLLHSFAIPSQDGLKKQKGKSPWGGTPAPCPLEYRIIIAKRKRVKNINSYPLRY